MSCEDLKVMMLVKMSIYLSFRMPRVAENHSTAPTWFNIYIANVMTIDRVEVDINSGRICFEES